ncbi:MAG: cupin [Lysobacterales bacterium]|jgi:anti-sigma factor ChrR (cupin superfamily)|nr:MAG: cupin [Xanthomonadales bacterium]
MDATLLNADFDRRVVVPPPRADGWVPSPLPGVDRHLLDRVGGEVARATSIVRYAPGSSFAAHVHGEGEEFLVLEGTFADEHGEYPAGTYVRNPPGTSHAPRSPAGCILFVKLRQFAATDTRPVRTDTRTQPWLPGASPGESVMPLHEHDGVATSLVRWMPSTRIPLRPIPDGEEILVLEGRFMDEHGEYPARTWLRNPPGSRQARRTGAEGALLYVKTGHLRRALP